MSDIRSEMMTVTANLGMASTEELFRELICRLAISPLGTPTDVGHYTSVQRGLILAEMLGSLETEEKEYRTVYR